MTVHLRHREIHEKTPIELFMSAAQASGVVAITAAAAHAVMEPVMAGSVARAVSRTFPIVWIISIPVFYLNRRSACRREAAMERLKDSAESFNLMNVESLAPKLDVREFDEATGVDAEKEAARLLRRGMRMLEAEDAAERKRFKLWY